MFIDFKYKNFKAEDKSSPVRDAFQIVAAANPPLSTISFMVSCCHLPPSAGG